jgi:hypothetical protein
MTFINKQRPRSLVPSCNALHLGLRFFYLKKMAENKKSFILYADLLKSIEHLTNEEKGILFNHLLEYVNDKNPILEDRLILTAWKPIELQLKRDLIKFEEVRVKRSEAGKKSAEIKAQQNSTKSTLVESVQHRSTKSTDNDNVNDNVINNKIEERKLKFADTLKPFVQTYGKEMIRKFYDYWTEPNKSKTKFKMELEKTWSLERRLQTWSDREKDFKKDEPIKNNIYPKF